MTEQGPLRIGARGSKLARWQCDWIADQLREAGVEVELVVIRTQGDVEQSGPVRDLGIQGVFTNEIQQALLRKEIDLAVHSLKDVPTAAVEGLCVAAVPRREDPSDAFVSLESRSFETLPHGARIGTGSMRRQAQLAARRRDVEIVGIRGNVDTRLQKLADGQFEAIILAAAGLRRLGLGDRITHLLGPPEMLPAPGQGALGLECRCDDQATLEAIAPLNHQPTRLAVVAERQVLATLRGGCSTPVGTWGRFEAAKLHLDAIVASLDGQQVLRASLACDACSSDDQAREIGQAVAASLLQQGAAQLVASK
ncbi:MAG: hydroxymethylbilane synthase [Planctomycetales bacterium]|nr:hydroxymethylbilane synthase [Planctomycetales bacterium]